MQPPDRSSPIMCDTSNYVVGVVLVQRMEKKLHVVYYINKMLNDAQINYMTTEKELLAVIFSLDKIRSCILDS